MAQSRPRLCPVTPTTLLHQLLPVLGNHKHAISRPCARHTCAGWSPRHTWVCQALRPRASLVPRKWRTSGSMKVSSRVEPLMILVAITR